MATDSASEQTAKPARTDWEAIERDYDSGLIKPERKGLESDIVKMFKACIKAGVSPEDRIPLNPEIDTVVDEMVFKHGRADIVVFHVDGSASIIEFKDGTRGYNHVVAGIGQAGLYAAQLYTRGGALSKVRKCLLWTSTGSEILDALICDVCEQANVIPMPWASMDKHIATWDESVRKSVANIMGEA